MLLFLQNHQPMIFATSIAVLGALIYKMSETDKEFSLSEWFRHIFLAGSLGGLTYKLVPEGNRSPVIIAGIGFLSLPIIKYFKKYGLKILLKKAGLWEEKQQTKPQ